MNTSSIVGVCAALLIGCGIYGLLINPQPLRKLLAFNVIGSGVFLLFGAIAKRGAAAGMGADPLPQALLITGIVVAFSATALAVLEAFPSARLLSGANLKTLTALVSKASKGRLAADYARRVRDAARTSVSAGIVNAGDEAALVSLIQQIRFADAQIEKAEEKIRAMPAPRAASLLASVKGLGTLLPRVIASEIGDMERFRHPPSGKPPRDMDKRILAFAGAEPRLRESGKWKGRTKISKRGSPALRTALWQASAMCRLHNPLFAAVYERQTARGKPHSVALFYVARKLVEVLCGMYKTDMPFSLQTAGATTCQ